MMAVVYSFVDALPPRSPVMDLPSAIVCHKCESSVSHDQVADTYGESSVLDLVGVVVEVHVPVHSISHIMHNCAG